MSTYHNISPEQLNHFRNQTDPLADEVIEAYFPQDKALLHQHLETLTSNSSQLTDEAKASLKTLYQDIQTKADLIPSKDLELGQRFFDQHASDIMLLLGLLSLPYCYAAAKGAEVLVRSKRILEEPERRLLETAEFVFDMMNSQAFEAKGKALSSVLKVRLMHAAARWYAKKGAWNTAELGEPVNQEDMAGTNLAFSLIVVRGLKKLGKSVSNQQAMTYIRYWNQIGALLGVDERLLPDTNKSSYILERNIRERHFQSSEAGKKLTKSLLSYFEKATIDSPVKGQSTSFVAFLLGEQVSGLLGIENTRFDAAIFQPYKYFYKIQNVLTLRSDSYSKALIQYKVARSAIQ